MRPMSRMPAGSRGWRALRGARGWLAVALVLSAPEVATAQSARHALDERNGSWAMVSEIEFGAIYLDTARIEVLQPEVYEVRTLWRFAEAQHDEEGAAYHSSVAERAIDCRSNSMALIAFADQDGPTIVNSADRPLPAAEWQSINPESVIARVADRACALGRAPRGAVQALSGGR